MLKHRLFFGALLIIALLGVLYLDYYLSWSGWSSSAPSWLQPLGFRALHGLPIAALLVVLVVLGTIELQRLFVAAGHAPLLGWPVVANIGFVLLTLRGDGEYAGSSPASALLCWLTMAFLGSAGLLARRRRTERAIGDLATTLLLILYLGLLPPYLLRIRLIDPGLGVGLLLYVVGAVKLCDIGAYFTGRAIGRHKLIVWLSPKKTIEGLAGGVAASVLMTVIVSIVVHRPEAPSGWAAVIPAPLPAAVLGMVLALLGQAGDLLESLFKRDAGAKDSANIIPAFGGILDILDSPLIAAPLAYAWLIQ